MTKDGPRPHTYGEYYVGTFLYIEGLADAGEDPGRVALLHRESHNHLPQAKTVGDPCTACGESWPCQTYLDITGS